MGEKGGSKAAFFFNPPLSFRCVRIFDLKEGGVQTLSAELKGHEGPVWQVAWANPRFGTILASCSYDRKVNERK